jgi:UDP-GlcNAc:undecaprenyl-phosphate/decaprenyl-phosphate GlcNAc-1-phosphate transferase
MNKSLLYSLIAILIAFAVSSAIIPLMKRIALALRALDYPGGRRDQPVAIPRLGGVAVVLGFLITQGIVAALCWREWKAGSSTSALILIPIALFIVFVSGLLEDTVGLSAIIRVGLQALAAVLAMKAGWSFRFIHLPVIGQLNFGILTSLISLLWIVGVTNAINLLDGLDGLAGGVTAIIASSMLVFSLWNHDFMAAIIMASIMGACLGFLRRNWAPAQIYLGDAGALTLGFILAIFSIHSSVKAPATVAILVPFLALGLPVIDTLLVMLSRFTLKPRRSGRTLGKRTARMFHADRKHLHYLMLHVVTSRRRIVIMIYSVAVFFCFMALVLATSKNMVLGIILIVLQISVIITMRQYGLHADMLRKSLVKRKEAKELLLGRSDSESNLKQSAG